MNALPNNKILDWFKFNAFAEDKINVTEILKFVLGRAENIVGKGENAAYQNFSPFPKMFSKDFFPKVVKSGLCGKEITASSPFPTMFSKHLLHYGSLNLGFCGKESAMFTVIVGCLLFSLYSYKSDLVTVFQGIIESKVCHYCSLK